MEGELYTQDKVLRLFNDAFNWFMHNMQVINGKWEDRGADYFRGAVIDRTSTAAEEYHNAMKKWSGRDSSQTK